MPARHLMESREELAREALPELFRRFMRMADWPAIRIPDDMKLDVTENDKEYLVKAEIPGAKKEDIRVNLDNNYVSISAEIKEEKKETKKQEGERMLLRELRYGNLCRGFSLPHEVDEKKSNARFENGVLTLTLPKRGKASGTALSIQ